MLKKRVIPVLLIKDGNLVKGEKFTNHKYVGDPINAVRIFNEKEVDEISLIDISFNTKNNGPNLKIIKEIASEAFMPIAFGGGISSVDHVKKLFEFGVEKVIINSAFFDNPNLISECKKIVGSQSIIIGIDVKISKKNEYEVFINNGYENTGCDPVEYAKKAEYYGAGEILLTSIDREGTNQGLDLKLIKQVASSVRLPIVAQGGVNSLEHIKQGITIAGASGVGVGSFFTFYGKHKAVLLTYPSRLELNEKIGPE